MGSSTGRPDDAAQGGGEATGIAPEFPGRPVPGAFAEAPARIGPGVPRSRVADVLGGRATLLGAALVARRGLLRDLDPEPFWGRRGLAPDAVAETT